MTNLFKELGYHTYHSTKKCGVGERRTASAVLIALDSSAFREDEVLRVVDIVPGKAVAVEIQGSEGQGATFICVHGPDSGVGSWAERAPFWAEVQMYPAARNKATARKPVLLGGEFKIWMDESESRTTQTFLEGWQACGFERAHKGGEVCNAPRASLPRTTWTRS